MGTVNKAMQNGGSLEALRSIGNYQNPISKIFSEALKIGYRNKIEVEDAMDRIFIVEMGKMTKSLDTIKTITELSPLLGLIGTVIGIYYIFKALGMGANTDIMAQGIYISLINTIFGLAVAIILLPLHSYISDQIDDEIDKIEIAKKMTNWSSAVMRIKVPNEPKKAVEALKESEGIVKASVITEKDANVVVDFKPSMLEKSIPNIILEKCSTKPQIIESKLIQ
jgi:biopolymer transport protein ExbB